jgi:hypothetical protein
MIRKLLFILIATLTVIAPARSQTIDQRVAAIEARLDAAGIAKLPAAATQPVVVPVVTSPPASTAIPAKPVAIANAVKLALAADKQQYVWKTSLTNTVVTTAKGPTFGAINLKGGTLQNVAFADGGYLCDVGGDGSKLLNVSFGNTERYAFFFTDATNVLIDGLYGKGISSSESFVRFSSNDLPNCTGTVYLEFVGSGKVCMRGNFAGTLENVWIKGSVFGLNPQDNDDEGKGHGITKWLVAGGGSGEVKAANIGDCLIAASMARAKPGATAESISKACLAVARDGSGKPIPGDIARTLATRKKLLARFTDAKLVNCTFEQAPVRWGAGTRLAFVGGRTIGDTIWNNPTSVYPDAPYWLPGDVARFTPDVTYTFHDFQTTISAADIKAKAAALSVKLVNCTRNGVAL